VAWYNPSWGYRVKITVQNGKVDADLTDFPVYVDLSDLPAGFHSHVKADGTDIVVTSSDEVTKLKREVVFITPGSSIGELHFKGDLTSASDTEFYIYYGNAGASETNDTDTWDGYYECVHHLQDDPSGTVYDSTSNDEDAAASGDPAQVDGKLSGKGIDIDGNDYLTITDGCMDMIGGKSPISHEFWYKETGATGQWNKVFDSEDDKYILFVNDAGISNLIYTYQGDKALDAITTDLWDGSWHHIFLTLTFGSPGIATIYIDGSSEDSDNNWSSVNAYTDVDYYINSAGGWQGVQDEHRISTGIERASTWISTQHNNHDDPDTFYGVGNEESAPSIGNPWWYYRMMEAA